jgi:DNA polymerase III epsilon subunit-like protein
MNYIVYDLEFNQNFDSLLSPDIEVSQCPFEIIQIGAVKLDSTLNEIAAFNRLVKPGIYMQINSVIKELTGIDTGQLLSEKPFPAVFNDFIEFIGIDDPVFCVWGMSDIKEIHRNTKYHQLDLSRLPKKYINLQPLVPSHLKLPQKKLLSLASAVELLQIITPYRFHDAYYDAYYTTEIFKKIYSPSIQPKHYDPDFTAVRPRQPKQTVDYNKLIQQFVKMYARDLSPEEQEMIILAYKMGRTHQFISEA